ncbi:MAG: hypothetical protein U0165_15685 [Polyangiaceae bacterium]
MYTSNHATQVSGLALWISKLNRALVRLSGVGLLVTWSVASGCALNAAALSEHGSLGQTCEPGHTSCSGDLGCDVNLLSDPNNCGGCGVVCNEQFAGSTCVQGTCVLTCSHGTLDCNGDGTGTTTEDGCEIDGNSDHENCGGCGIACAADETCFRGSCACGGVTLNGQCNFDPLCGCGEHLNCVLADIVSGSGQCVPEGNTPDGAACSQLNECTRGSSCFGGVCRPYCESDAECGGGFCMEVSTPDGAHVPGLKFCMSP